MTAPANMNNDELNAAVATEVMEWTPKRTASGNVTVGEGRYWDPATDIAAAFEVVERMRERGFFFWSWWAPENHEPGKAHARFAIQRAGPASAADTFPRAICEAALATVRSES